ncbi:carbohydrate ABC transporter permease [Brachybacterium sp. YJGR34]|uniref:carbohydrate ABC transporter permease n=1 Tax=Brachybacterium sp. YJGR34 TaxID=2059911 RepID=UPI000E0A9074|nr:carbohydrate ABC transporter permease [Brachybacterium sp. YJGR34]
MTATTDRAARPSRSARAASLGDTAGPFERAFKGIVLTIACALVIIPFIGIVSTSLAPADQVNSAGGFVLFPREIDLTAYRSILSGGVVARALLISIGVTAVGTALSLALTTTLAWALSRRGTVGNRQMLLLVLISLLFAPGLIPTYLVVKQFDLIDSLWALIIPTSVSAFNVIVVRAFFANIPAELIDAASIDGATEWQIFRRIGLPLSKAVLAVVGLFYGVGYWNAFFNALLYLNDAAKWPLQMVLRTYVVNGTEMGAADMGQVVEAAPPQSTIQMAILVISIIPILVVYPFLQKHFAKGMLTGAVKG